MSDASRFNLRIYYRKSDRKQGNIVILFGSTNRTHGEMFHASALEQFTSF